MIKFSAAKCTIVEVEEIVEIGELDPSFIHLPGIYVDRIVKPVAYTKFVEVRVRVRFVEISILDC